MIALQFGSGRNPFEASMYDYLKLEDTSLFAKVDPAPTLAPTPAPSASVAPAQAPTTPVAAFHPVVANVQVSTVPAIPVPTSTAVVIKPTRGLAYYRGTPFADAD